MNELTIIETNEVTGGTALEKPPLTTPSAGWQQALAAFKQEQQQDFLYFLQHMAD